MEKMANIEHEAINLLNIFINNNIQPVEKRPVKIFVPETGRFCDYVEHKINNLPRCYVLGKMVGKNKNGKPLFLNYYFFKLKPGDLGKEIVCDCEIIKSSIKDRDFYHLRLVKRNDHPQIVWGLEVRDEFIKGKNSFALPQFGRTKIVFTFIEQKKQKKENIIMNKIHEFKFTNKKNEGKMEQKIIPAPPVKQIKTIELVAKTTKKAVSGVSLSKIDEKHKVIVNFAGESYEGFLVEEALIIMPKNSNRSCFKAKFFEGHTSDNKIVSGIELVNYNCEKNEAVVKTGRLVKIISQSALHRHPDNLPIVGTDKAIAIA